MHRRDFLRGLSILPVASAALSLSACGFHLRGNAKFVFKKLYTGLGDSSLGLELARNLRSGSEAVMVADRKDADAVLDVLENRPDKIILSRNSSGQVQEYRLTHKFRFRVHDGKGKELLQESEILLTQDVSFNASDVLAKDYEEALLRRSMQSDLVQQLMRRLESIKAL